MQITCWDKLDKAVEIAGKAAEHGLNRYLLYGPPGTGKSSFPARRFRKVYRFALTEDTAPEDLVGTWRLTQGDMIFAKGPAPLAMLEGCPLVLDEIDRTGPSCESLLHAILDDAEIATIMLPTGEVVKPKRGYMVFGTTNAAPHTLQEALLDRFDVCVHLTIPHPDAIKVLQPDTQKLVKNYYRQFKQDGFKPTLSYRRAKSFDILRNHLAPEIAAQLVYGANWMEILSDMASAVKEAD